MHAEESFPGELTAIARRGSGSACRSLHGGFVKWLRGTADDGWVGSVAQQVQPETHWPALRALVLVACADRKHVGSTLGMQLTVRTSRLFEHRVGSGLCEETLAAFEAAIEARDMARFAELAMRDSNQFHAVCADTYPPIFYMTDTSRRIVRMVHAFNEHAGKVVAGYTFDAGPNAVIYCEEETVPALMRWVLYFFPPPAAAGPLESFFPAAEQVLGAGFDVAGLAAPEGSAKEMGEDRDEGKLSRVIYTSAGPGPIRLDDAEGLLDTTTWEVAK
jgi:diphosphomevalonate decarboxylase